MAAGAVIAPTSQRIEALDFVRGVALFGILLMNIVGMGLGPAYDDPTVAGGAEGVNLWAWIITSVGFEGTQRALFSMLFGAGIILFTSRLEKAGRTDVADIYLRRNMWLIAFGCVNSFVLLWIGDILYYYGITALFLFVFRTLSAKRLLVIGTTTLLFAAGWNAVDAIKLLDINREYEVASTVPETSRTAEQKKAVEAWAEEEKKFRPPPGAFAEIQKEHITSYWSAAKARAALNVHFQSWHLYRFFFDVFGMMMIGMGLFKIGLLTLEVRSRVYLAMVFAGYAIGLAVNVTETRWIIDHAFSRLSYAQAAVTYDLGRLSMTLGHLGILMLFLRSGALTWFRQSMAAVGRMALSNYITHSVIALILFIGFGMFGKFERHQLYLIVFAIWVVQLIVSPIWLRHFRFGPVEWLWRYLTYGKAPSFRHAPSLGGAIAAAD